ncbi:hypothetical protein K9L67_01645 [Candidatus Woesearchaeota archaeon]|nr:hypothetical protein [Candidatus Woesearchaeota archaeon]MCF7900907.1 hypothetical protein [Candidatus Woesearchaeota archaeon]MCF8013044.1 hypothetical protein [Candidatus Woesearchaeota archaeon]
MKKAILTTILLTTILYTTGCNTQNDKSFQTRNTLTEEEVEKTRMELLNKKEEYFKEKGITMDSIYAYPKTTTEPLITAYLEEFNLAEIYLKGITPNKAKKYKDQTLESLKIYAQFGIEPEFENKIPEQLKKFHIVDLYKTNIDADTIKSEYEKFNQLESTVKHDGPRNIYDNDFVNVLKSCLKMKDFEKYWEINNKYKTHIDFGEAYSFEINKTPFYKIKEAAKTHYKKILEKEKKEFEQRITNALESE